MHQNLSENSSLLVISDTGMCFKNKELKAFGPVVKELDYLLKEYKFITWIGFDNPKEIENKSFLKVNQEKIKLIRLKKVGGKLLSSKMMILLAYPKMIMIIYKEIKKHKYIHTRAPSNPAVIAMFLSIFFRKKKFWHKYAGSWVDKAPFFYSLQRRILQRIPSINNTITVNGRWNEKRTNIISFENPCLDKNDRIIGKEIIHNKNLSKAINFCFVGALNTHKGVDKILEAFSKIKSNKVGKINLVGSSELKKRFVEQSKFINHKIIFHGFLEKDKIREVYKESHFIILPSKSEGFPKVIGEGMNYGCIPIVSDVSCINQYIKDAKNGFLIKPLKVCKLIEKINESLNLSSETYQKIIFSNFKDSNKFTYNYYNNRIKEEVFNA